MIILPEPTEVSLPFWEGLKSGEIRLQRCGACGVWRHPPQLICSTCRSGDFSWERASGQGRIFSFTEIHHAVHPAVIPWLPYVVLQVELGEGPIIVSRLRHGTAEIRKNVVPVFEPVTPDVTLLLFDTLDGSVLGNAP